MTTNLIEDIALMHRRFGMDKRHAELDPELFAELLKFRLSMIEEELDETKDAMENKDAEEFVDGLIDIIVFTLGTLDACGVNTQQAWDEVLGANLAKQPGIKAERPNKFGFPDLTKPEGWCAPSHKGNTGRIEDAF